MSRKVKDLLKGGLRTFDRQVDKFDDGLGRFGGNGSPAAEPSPPAVAPPPTEPWLWRNPSFDDDEFFKEYSAILAQIRAESDAAEADRPIGRMETDELSAILTRIRVWPASDRFALVRGVLETVAGERNQTPRALRGRPAAEILATFATDRTPPDDETVRRWVDEHRRGRYDP